MRYGVSELPYVYIFTALFSVLIGLVYAKMQNSLDIQKVLRVTMYFMLALILSFFLLIKFAEYQLTYMGIMIAKDILWLFIGMEFGILSGIIFDIRQGKRLFGLLMSGEILSGILGGLSITYILNYIAISDLLLISLISLILSIFILNTVLKRFSYRFQSSEMEKEPQENYEISYFSLMKNRYYLLFFAVSALSFLVFYFIDYIFYFKVGELYTNEKELAGFFGVFIALLNAVNLLFSLFYSGRLLNHYGIGFGLLSIPVLAIVGTSSLLISMLFSVGIAFICLIILKLLDEIFDISILTPSFRVIYQSIPQNKRMRVVAFRETVIEPAAMSLAGGALILLSSLKGMEAVIYTITVLSIIWLAVAKLLKHEYIEAVKKQLGRRQMLSSEELLGDIDNSFFLNGINSKNEVEVIYSLELLEKTNYDKLDEVLHSLTGHENPRVRVTVLKIISRLESYELASSLRDSIDQESDPEVYALLLDTYCKILKTESINVTVELLHSDKAYIKESAIVSLMRYCEDEGKKAASQEIKKLLIDTGIANRINVLSILNKIGFICFDGFIKESFESKNRDLKIKAIETIGDLKIQKLSAELINTLKYKEYRSASIASLTKLGISTTRLLINSFEASEDTEQRAAIIKVLASFKDDEANSFIMANKDDELLVDVVYESLFQNSYVSKNKKLIIECLNLNSRSAINRLNILNSLDEKRYPNTFGIIKNSYKRKIDNIFMLLSFIFHKETITKARSNYQSGVKDKKAFAVEVLDNLLSKGLKRALIPILEESSVYKKLFLYKNRYMIQEYDEKEYFNSVLKSDGHSLILRLSLIYEIGKNKERYYSKSIAALADADDIYIKETAGWAVKQLV